jgi:hypothetical protein
MRIVAIASWMIAIAACSGGTPSSTSSQERVKHDVNCSSYKDQKSCVADTADQCHWIDVVVSQLTCAGGPGTCPLPPPNGGFCLGQDDGDQCVIATQCTRLADEASCAADSNCQWEPAACPIANAPQMPAPGGVPPAPRPAPPPCPDHVCTAKNVCEGLNVGDCKANPSCELLVGGGCACPAPAPCPAGSACPPPPPCECGPGTPVCVHKPVECFGGGSGSGSSADAGAGAVGGSGGGVGGPPGSTSGSGGSAPQPI